jgi:hypothetical protein
MGGYKEMGGKKEMGGEIGSAPAGSGSSLDSNAAHLSKIQNGRHKQRSGQHTLARQKNIKKRNKIVGIDIEKRA